jgi:tetratricopeptide (TPR) repeat protein
MNKTMRILKSCVWILFIGIGFQAIGQTNREKANALKNEAIELMDNGDYKTSLSLLEEAKSLDPGNVDYPYEMAYAYYSKGDYKKAARILEGLKSHGDATDLFFQLLGNSYDMMGKAEKAFDAYDQGLKKFPKSGRLFLEKGNVYWGKKEFEKALPFYEEGVEADPSYPSNYFRLAILYCHTSEEVWGMIYGELFMNLERNSERTAQISKLLYDTYKREITLMGDGEYSVSFSKNANNINSISSVDINQEKFPIPFGMIYESALGFSMLNVKTIDMNSLDSVRQSFIDYYFTNEFTYPNVLFDYQKKIKDAGHMEAYNHWILMKGDEAAFGDWQKQNEEKWDAFIDWFNENQLELDENNRFYSTQYE